MESISVIIQFLASSQKDRKIKAQVLEVPVGMQPTCLIIKIWGQALQESWTPEISRENIISHLDKCLALIFKNFLQSRRALGQLGHSTTLPRLIGRLSGLRKIGIGRGRWKCSSLCGSHLHVATLSPDANILLEGYRSHTVCFPPAALQRNLQVIVLFFFISLLN